MKKGFALVLLLAAFGSSPALAERVFEDCEGPGFIPVFACGILAGPGCYRVTPTAIAAGAGVCITIAANHVTLNLNGKSIVGGVLTTDIINVTGAVVTIQNGRLINGVNGINYVGAAPPRLHIEGVEMVSNTGAPGYRGVNVQVSAGPGHVEVISSRADGGGGGSDTGIYISPPGGAVTSWHGRIVDNLVTNFGKNGIYLNGLHGGEVLRNIVNHIGNAAAPSAMGIFLTAFTPTAGGNNVVDGNTVHDATHSGIYVDLFQARNRISDNITNTNRQYGISVQSDENRVIGNVASDNGLIGIIVGGLTPIVTSRNYIGENQAANNCDCQIQYDCNNHVYRDNIVRTTTPSFCGPGNTFCNPGIACAGSAGICLGNTDAGGNVCN